MHDSTVKYNYDALWKIIDTPQKFELLSYLILCLKYPELRLYKTPQTRDHKRDGEGFLGEQKFFFESKYFYDSTTKKLSHKEVGSNINIAVYELADMLWIFTNGYVQLDLLNFINWHNDIQESILHRPLKIIILNRQQIAMHSLRYSENDYQAKLSDLKFKGYKTLKASDIASKKAEMTVIGEHLISSIQEVKRNKQEGDFFYYPTIQGLLNSKWSEKDKTEIFKNLFQPEVSYLAALNQQCTDQIIVAVGYSFYIVIKISNFFFDEISFSVNLLPEALIKFIGMAAGKDNKYFLETSVGGMAEKVIIIQSRIDRLPVGKIDAFINVNNYRIPIHLNQIQANNLFFLAPFIGERNNEQLSLYKEKIDRAVYEEKFFFGLITGEAGAGKSHFIREVIDHCSKYSIKLFRSELVAEEGRKTLLRDIIAFFSGIDPISFTEASDQLFIRYKNDKNFAALFSSNKEFDNFTKTVEVIVKKGLDQVSFSQINKIAEFIGKSLLHLGGKYLTVIAIEDLHHADKPVFHFLSRLYESLKTQKSKIVFLMAGRTEAKDITTAFREFEALIFSDPTYSITQTRIQPLSLKDSISLVKELVITESKFETIIRENILKKTGNNPFNIIHTLIYLKNAGVIVQKGNDFEWRQLNKLEGITIHEEVEKLLKDRFDFYVALPRIGKKIVDIIGTVCLFETRIRMDDLIEIWKSKEIAEIIDFLRRERIIKTEGGDILFDHENIFQYVQENILPGAIRSGERIIDWLSQKNSRKKYPSLLIRCLNVCFKKHPADFFKNTFSYLQEEIAKDNWKEILRYGAMFLGHTSDDESYKESIRKYKIMFAMANVESEYADLAVAIHKYEELETALKVISNSFSKISNIDSIEKFLLFLKTRLYRCDAMIMANDYIKTEVLLIELIDEITRFQETNGKYRNHPLLSELHCWALNRLAIVYRISGQTIKAFELMKKSLVLARKIKHAYFIHHNYYDMAGCLLLMDRIEDAYKMHKRCLMPILYSPDQVNALVRSKIRTGLFHILLNDAEKAAIELETAVQVARERGYLWELTRGLINQANLYFQQKNISIAYETYKTCLHFIDIHNAKAFYSCLYNNFAFLYLNNYRNSKEPLHLEMSLNYFLQSMCETNTLLINEYGKQNIHSTISLLNLFTYKEFIEKYSGDSTDINVAFGKINTAYHKLIFLKPKLIKPGFIEKFNLKLSDDLSFYLMYMSFS